MYWQCLWLRAPLLDASGGAYFRKVVLGAREEVSQAGPREFGAAAMEQCLTRTDQKLRCNADGDDRTHIRAATVADIAAIVTCLDLAFVSSAGHAIEVIDDVQLADNLKSQILDGSIRLICEGSNVLGYISFGPAAAQMFIDTLAVLPTHHRRGLGRKLLAFADFETIRLGLKGINLFTKTAMTGNQHFYQSCGYRETGRCDDDGFSRVFYTKKLPSLTAFARSAQTVL